MKLKRKKRPPLPKAVPKKLNKTKSPAPAGYFFAFFIAIIFKKMYYIKVVLIYKRGFL